MHIDLILVYINCMYSVLNLCFLIFLYNFIWKYLHDAMGVNSCFSFTYHWRGSIKSYLLLKCTWSQTTTMFPVCCGSMSFDWAIEVAKKNWTDWNAVNICKNIIIIMANRWRSFIKCLHLKVPTLKPTKRYEWIYEIADKITTSICTTIRSVYIWSLSLFYTRYLVVVVFSYIKTLHDWENLARI